MLVPYCMATALAVKANFITIPFKTKTDCLKKT